MFHPAQPRLVPRVNPFETHPPAAKGAACVPVLRSDAPLEHAGVPAAEFEFESSSADVEARYKRCAAHWESHLQRTRSVILEAARLCNDRRKAVILGAGLLHDIPLGELSGLFKEVILVDAAHSKSCRIRAGIFPNVSLLQTDVTGTSTQVLLASKTGAPIPRITPGLLEDAPGIDLTVSVNLLSQIGCAPGKLLRRSHSQGEIESFQRHLIQSHLDYLRLRPGHAALVTDFAWSSRPAHKPDAGEIRRWDVLHGVPLPPAPRLWEWNIAPAPECDPHADFVAHVAGFADWKKAAGILGP